MKVDYSIEYAHTYIDEVWNEEHVNIGHKVLEITRNLQQQGKSYTLNVLIDDYNPEMNVLDVEDLCTRLEDLGLRPDNVLFESELTKLEDDLFKLLDDGRIKNSYRKYIENKNHIPCSFLIAVWYALRLGIIEKDGVSFYKETTEKPFAGEKLINILQSRYADPEEKASEIISISSFSDKIDDVEDIFV